MGQATVSTKETGQRGPPPSPSATAGQVRHRRRRLANLQNVKLGLADCIRELEDGTRDAGTARALIYGYATLAGIIQGTDLEERIAKLEAVKQDTKRGGA